jgi:hypothetical protein
MFLYNAKVSQLLLQSPSHLQPETTQLQKKAKWGQMKETKGTSQSLKAKFSKFCIEYTIFNQHF